MLIELGFPFILDSKREGDDDYSMGWGGGGLVWPVSEHEHCK